MHTVFAAFDKKVSEVELYFKFLELTQQPDVVLHFRNKKSRRYRAIDLDTQRILKAGAFLVMYNLVESSIRLGVKAIYTSVKNDSLPYEKVREEIRHIWVDYRFKDLDKGNVGRDRYREVAKGLIESIVKKDVIDIGGEYVPVSGNLDARKVRELAETHGFSWKVLKHLQGGPELEKVKRKRNELAHGLESFTDCGGSYTMTELNAIKSQVVVYVRNILRNIRRYVKRKQYVA